MRSWLPIDDHLEAIVSAVRRERGAVIVAEPGAGKTTRVPAALLDAGFSESGEILVLQPRRLATRLAARRVAQERREEVGAAIGYQVRFEDRTSAATRVRFITEGILTRRLARDRQLRGVSAVVFDEFHERSLHGDLGLAFVRRLQKTERPDLAVLVMSATLEAEPVARFLQAPIFQIEGRTFPVDVQYQASAEPGPNARPLAQQVSAAVRAATRTSLDGDVLVFLPGASEIRRAHEACVNVVQDRAELWVLHGDLPARDQDRVLAPRDRPKVILATNVAETSITIEGVTTVIDSGLARIARHSPWTGLPTLEVEKISQASAVQRTGRAGRVQPGRCIRLYSQHDFEARPLRDDPEIRRAELTETLLFLASGGEDPRSFPFFESPPEAAWHHAYVMLERLGAISPEDGQLTAVGREISALPVHPRLGRLLVEARDREVGARGSLLAALIGEREIRRSVRTQFGEHRVRDDVRGTSDLLERLEAFECVEAEGFSREAFRIHDVDSAATQMTRKSRDQFLRLLGESATPKRTLEDEEEALRQSLLVAFSDRVGRRRTQHGRKVVFADAGSGELDPTSVVKDAEFLVAINVVARSGTNVIRAASAIEPEWLLELFPDRIKEHRELRFDEVQERVEQVVSLRYERLVLDQSRHHEFGPPELDAASTLLAREVLNRGISSVWNEADLDSYWARLGFAAQHGLEVAVPDRETLVMESCHGLTTFRELRGFSPVDLLMARMTPEVRRRFGQLAPATVALPGRRAIPVVYPIDREPYIESRIQDFFGLSDGPRIADGQVPLLLHLLAPNRRPVQVTKDLSGFWDRHYPDLRKELKRRYYKHLWPEDPRAPIAQGSDRSRR